MKTKKGIGFLTGVILGIILGLSYEEWDKEKALSAFPILERQGYTVAYDTRGKIPFWTREYLTQENLEKKGDRSQAFFQEDPELYKPHRSELKDYKKSGFDRGHVVPAGDHSYSLEALKETFYLSNICPQHPDCNRGIWKKLEGHLRDLVKGGISLEIISGPLFLSHEEEGKRLVTYQVIGANDVAVPTHFFKVVRSEKEMWAYVIPNNAISGELESFRFPIDKLEKISGIRFQH